MSHRPIVHGRTFREQLEALWMERPELSMKAAHALTGAPTSIVRHVRHQLIAAGKVKPGNGTPSRPETLARNA